MTAQLMYGSGNLASAVVRRWLQADIKTPDISVYRAGNRLDGYAVNHISEQDLEQDWDEIWIGVKPQVFNAIHTEIARLITPRTSVVSLMAGVKTQHIARRLGCTSTARVMTNLLTESGQGASALCTLGYSQPEIDALAARLAPLGEVAVLADESRFEVATALIGSSPAFVAEFGVALAEAVIAAGWQRSMAEKITASVLKWTAGALATEISAREGFIDRVTSKGGTTAAGMAVLRPALRELIAQALAAAVARGEELSAGNF